MNLRIGESSGAQNIIGFTEAVARMHEPVCRIAVIGDENKPLRIIIQPSDGIEPVRKLLKEIGDLFPVLILGIGTDNILGFIECYHHAFIVYAHPFSVKGHYIAIIDVHADLGDRTVELYPALLDQLFTFSS